MDSVSFGDNEFGVEVWITAKPGFFGPRLHAYENCSETRPDDVFVSLMIGDSDLALLDRDWLCAKCGAVLTDWLHA